MEIFTLVDIIENASTSQPDKEAFKCGKETITYRELSIKTSQLAHYLNQQGVKIGDRVGIYLNRSLETAIAIYGILKAGAAYVPLDFSAPHTRTSYVLKNCDIRYLISSPKLRSKVKSLLETESNLSAVIGLKTDIISSVDWEDIYTINISNFKPLKITGHNLAYVMFTSGSTGLPKGIMHTHNSGLNYAKLSASLYDVTLNDRVGNHAPIHFDISTFGYFSAPLRCATTIIATDAHTKLPSSLAQLIDEENLSIWYSVPLALIQILQTGLLDRYKMFSLRWVLFGGEVFPLKHLRTFIEKWEHVTFSNVYGPAEVNQCTFYNFRSLPDFIDTLPIGKVWGNTSFRVLDECDNPVKLGDKGKLLINSGTMMQGYWKNPELTSKSFYTENSDDGLEIKFYRTGDIVSEREDGNLLFYGRNDRQVKVRGYRIELDEIEASILKHPEIREVAVIVDTRTDATLIYTAVLLIENSRLTAHEVKLYCKQNLPVYAIPDIIQIHTNLPRTSSGKIDRKHLTPNN
ncbi:amino acid adenylation domain-containing protein [Hyunsoonleella jejuensis]|uniref:Amino acid adenylation domain-containing protein n=1 Tax=Hyunsoonleella jejuensis TaxID=419940 RepID=A0A1H9KJJ2_9FLAO|nr:amino acid adenylation domain-containing protein [Hyunsoonleella jejuensis]SEQ99087.1 amino acid adenylation domain-containing protein [Hyunsoonleella jejuensis]